MRSGHGGVHWVHPERLGDEDGGGALGEFLGPDRAVLGTHLLPC